MCPSYQVILLGVCCHAAEAVAVSVLGEAIGKLLRRARLGAVENHNVASLERRRNPR